MTWFSHKLYKMDLKLPSQCEVIVGPLDTQYMCGIQPGLPLLVSHTYCDPDTLVVILTCSIAMEQEERLLLFSFFFHMRKLKGRDICKKY